MSTEARTSDPMMQPCRRGCGELVHLENDGFHVCRPVARSARHDVRNPLLALQGVQALLALPEDQRKALRFLLRDIAFDARCRAEKCWRTHKAPMATYWKAVAVYAGHTSRALR